MYPQTRSADFARLIAKTKPCMLVTGWGAARATLTENFAWAGILLNAMTANMGKPGTSPVVYNSYPASFTTYPVPSSSTEIGRKPATFAIQPLIAFQKWADAILMRGQLDSGQMKEADYRQAIGNAANLPLPNIRVWFATHYCIQMQVNVNKEVECMKKLDLSVVHRVMSNDSTMRLADILLPLVEDLERDASFQGFPNGFCYCAKLLNQPGECRSEEWLSVHLAQRLGVLDNYFPKFSSYNDATWDQMWVDMCKSAYDKWAASATIQPLNPPAWADFLKKPVFRWAMTTPPYVALDAEINKGKKFLTPSGKIQAYDDDLGKGLDYLKTTKYGGFLDPYPAYHPELQFGGYHDPNAPDRPIVCFTPQPRYRTHSWMAANPWLIDELFQHAVVLSVSDAKAAGVKDGDMAVVSSDVGKTKMPVAVTSRLLPGSCIVYKGTYWNPDPTTGFDLGGNSNALMTDQSCPAKTYPNINRVKVTKA